MTKPVHDVALALTFRPPSTSSSVVEWLVARRYDAAHLGGLWEFPGGKRRPDEPPADAAVRELLEETGVRAVPLRVLDTVVCEYEDRVVRLTPVLCRWVAGAPRPLGNAQTRWVATPELTALAMPAANRGLIQALLRLAADRKLRSD